MTYIPDPQDLPDANEPHTGTVRTPSTELLVTADTAAGAARTSVVRRIARDPQAVITLAILVIFLFLGVFAQWIAPQDPNASDLRLVNAPVGTPGYPLGGDESGRDILSRLLYSLTTAVVSAGIGAGVALVIGVVAGLVGGYFGAVTRGVTEWTFSLIMTFPGILLLIILMPVTGGDYRATMLIFGVLLAPGIYRIVRNLVLGVKNELYVDAARVSGLGNIRILGRHVLFVVRGPIIIAAAFMAGSAINVQSGLAFLGVGSLQVPSFGAMIASGFRNLYIAPTQFLWPSLTLGVITAALVLLGNSLRDVLEGTQPKPVKLRPSGSARTETVRAADPRYLLEISDLRIAYPAANGQSTEVVRGVSLALAKGETLGLVGESGSGKSQTAFATLGVLPNEATITAGSIRFEGRELVDLPERAVRSVRGTGIAYIPQEPMSNLDPSFRIGAQLVEGVRAASGISRSEAKQRVLSLLSRCGIADPDRTFRAYPHEVSGGMAQRVLIAGAVASRPKLLIADEPTTALDVTVQAEILDLLRDLQTELGMAVLLVTHNFGVVADICDRIAVMNAGEILEVGDALDIFDNPQHEYTRMLLNAILDEGSVRTDPPAAAGAGRAES